MKRWDVINLYIEKYQYKDYLEIGSESGMCRDNILAENKVTVDPCKTANNPTGPAPIIIVSVFFIKIVFLV